MSLTLYFYKCKKGTVPDCKKKEWYCQRRMYFTYDIVCRTSSARDKNGYPIYPLTKECLDKMTEHYRMLSMTSLLGYDDNCEKEGLSCILGRTIDFDKYDYYILNA